MRRRKAGKRFDDATRRACLEQLASGYLALPLVTMSDHWPGEDPFLAALPLTRCPPDDVTAVVRRV